MNRHPPGRMRTVLAVAGIVVIIVVLGALQYRWNRDASEAAAARLADSLQLSMINWHLDLFRNLSEIALIMRPPSQAADGAEDYVARLQEWRGVTRYPELVSGLYVLRQASGGDLEVERLASAAGGAGSPCASGSCGSRSVERALRYVTGLDAGRTAAELQPVALSRDARADPIGQVGRTWYFDPKGVAMVRTTRPDREWLLVELDTDVLADRILPDLAHRYFQGTHGLDYEVAVVAGGERPEVLYTSDPGYGATVVADADGRMDVFGRQDGSGASQVSVFHPPSVAPGPTPAVGVRWFPLAGNTPRGDDWQLVVRHRRGGSLGSFVEQTRRRGLLVSYIALFLLVLSFGTLLVGVSRAQRLAQLQMDFVTAVSHELRTPLTVIASAADNIANGVVDTRDRLREYGIVIGQEVSQLSGLVERILRFAATRQARQTYLLEPLDVGEVIDTVLAGTGGLIRAARFEVERHIDPGLPPCLGDRVAVCQCVENLVTNALKYGRDAHWLRIAAVPVAGPAGVIEAIEIEVTDRGIGISADEVQSIFEPFYRAPAAQAAQIHGTGLGLAVARQIAHDLGGALTVTSAPGLGSTFVLRLRAAASATPAA